MTKKTLFCKSELKFANGTVFCDWPVSEVVAEGDVATFCRCGCTQVRNAGIKCNFISHNITNDIRSARQTCVRKWKATTNSFIT
jgi:hypothetical protein